MLATNHRLATLAEKVQEGKIVRVAILGLGSVGNYLMEYLNNWDFPNFEVHVGCRNVQKAKSDVNIVRVARLIRGKSPKNIQITSVDLDDIESIKNFLCKVRPDFVVNSSRAYSGLKYGSISWHTIRAYGLWAPLAMKYIRNIMAAHREVGSDALVINTSYSDAVIPWLKSAGMAYPDFGSGNLNHLIPRIKMAVASFHDGLDANELDVELVTSHFHDVVISKEGQTEGINPLLRVAHHGEVLDIADVGTVYKACAISMPVDAKRNMMNASSNFEIISKITEAISGSRDCVLHSPGVGGNLGGYPVYLKATTAPVNIAYDERYFSFAEMNAVNRRSIYLDGIEDVRDGSLFWTSELADKVKKSFGVTIPREVGYDEIPRVAEYIIDRIIKPYLASQGK